MTSLKRKFWSYALVQTCVVAAIVGWHFYVGVSEYLAHPPDGDMYAHTWSFQAIVFAIFTLPRVLAGLTVLLGLEWFIARRISKRQIFRDDTVA